MNIFKSLASLVAAIVCAGLVTSCACHKTAQNGKTCPMCAKTAASTAKSSSGGSNCTMNASSADMAAEQQVVAKASQKKNDKMTAAPVTPAPAPAVLTKDQQLAQLLAKYESNTITPLEYHTQRAALLAQP